MSIRLKRVYETASPGDGRRYLVDRLWPRGVSKEEARLTGWVRDLAPSTGLRLWYHRDPARFGEFRERYRKELTAHAAELALLAKEARRTPVTLVFSAREAARSNAAVLKELLEVLG